MRWCLYLVVGLVLLCGCHGRQRTAIVAAPADRPGCANLALGPSAETARLATLYVGRSDWPATEIGYRIDDVTFYESTNYDVQLHFDRNTSFYQAAQTVRTGMWLR